MLLQMAVFHSFLWPSTIPLYINTFSFIHLSVDGDLGCFQIIITVVVILKGNL